jgi:hypothetical protein
MMRIIALSAAALLASAGVAFAAPASVTVSIGPELQAKAANTLGVRDVNELADELRTAVQKRLEKTNRYDGARIELVLVDAKPTRPTFKQLGDSPGLSYSSFGRGGAAIEGRAIAPDGAVTPLSFKDYEADLRQSRLGSTWSDAQMTIDRFAYYLGRGEEVIARR